MEKKPILFNKIKGLSELPFMKVLNKYFWIGPLVLTILVYILTTRHGIGLSPDSIAYLGAATNLKNGIGLSLPYGLPPNQPLTQFPPLLPIILYIISKTGIPIIFSAKLLNLLLVTSFVFLSDLILSVMDNRNSFIKSSVLSLVSVFVVVQFIFNMLWSEPLMIVLGLAGFLIFFYSQKYNNFYYLILSGILFGLAVSARYAGVTYLATALIVVLLNSSNNWEKKVFSWIALSIPTSIFLYFWMTREIGNAVSTTGRVVNFHPFGISHLHQILTTVGLWFQLPNSAPTLLKLFATIVFVGFFLYITWFVILAKRFKDNYFYKILIIFVYVYGGFVLLSLMFLDANIPLDTRILSPVLFTVLLLVITISKFQSQNKNYPGQITRTLAIVIPIAVVGIFLHNISNIKDAYQNGIGFNNVIWKRYESIQYLNNLPQDHLLISNAPEPVFYFTNNLVYSLPKQYLAMQQEQNSNYGDEINQLIKKYLTEKTYFIFFHKIKGGSDSDISSFQNNFNLILEKNFDEATIFSYNPRK